MKQKETKLETINMSDFTTAELEDAKETLQINIKTARREILTSTNDDMVKYYKRNLPTYLEKLTPILAELGQRSLAEWSMGAPGWADGGEGVLG